MVSAIYSPLKDPYSSIRLLSIDRVQGSTIHCRLNEYSLKNHANYVAISYAWGSAVDATRIVVNGHSFPIRYNIWTLLERISHDKTLQSALFWIDAVCINQRDFKERGIQVRIMRQIYHTATEVIIWLGRRILDSDLAMRWLCQSRLLDFGGPLWNAYSWTKEEGIALLGLFQRDYWTRVWIVQEITNAREVTVMCGTQKCSLRNLTWLCWSPTTITKLEGIDGQFPFAKEILRTEAAYVVWIKMRWDSRPSHEKEGIPLSELIMLLGHLQSTDPFDRIYGLLGLAYDGHKIKIDYHQTAPELYNNVLELACNEQGKSRDYLEAFSKKLADVLGLHQHKIRSLLRVADLVSKQQPAFDEALSTTFSPEVFHAQVPSGNDRSALAVQSRDRDNPYVSSNAASQQDRFPVRDFSPTYEDYRTEEYLESYNTQPRYSYSVQKQIPRDNNVENDKMGQNYQTRVTGPYGTSYSSGSRTNDVLQYSYQSTGHIDLTPSLNTTITSTYSSNDGLSSSMAYGPWSQQSTNTDYRRVHYEDADKENFYDDSLPSEMEYSIAASEVEGYGDRRDVSEGDYKRAPDRKHREKYKDSHHKRRHRTR